jgi:hypothetical protein
MSTTCTLHTSQTSETRDTKIMCTLAYMRVGNRTDAIPSPRWCISVDQEGGGPAGTTSLNPPTPHLPTYCSATLPLCHTTPQPQPTTPYYSRCSDTASCNGDLLPRLSEAFARRADTPISDQREKGNVCVAEERSSSTGPPNGPRFRRQADSGSGLTLFLEKSN